MAVERPLTLDRTTTVPAGGVASVSFPGPAPWYWYEVDTIALECSGVLLPTAKLTNGGQLLGTTLDGASGSFERTGESDKILPGETWVVEWTGASVGATARATLSGTERSNRQT